MATEKGIRQINSREAGVWLRVERGAGKSREWKKKWRKRGRTNGEEGEDEVEDEKKKKSVFEMKEIEEREGKGGCNSEETIKKNNVRW